MRDAPSIEVIFELTKLGAKVQGFDPEAGDNARQLFANLNNVSIVDNAYGALENANALLLLTEWDEFKSPDFEKMKKLMNGNVIVDGRNIWTTKQLDKYSLIYINIGR